MSYLRVSNQNIFIRYLLTLPLLKTNVIFLKCQHNALSVPPWWPLFLLSLLLFFGDIWGIISTYTVVCLSFSTLCRWQVNFIGSFLCLSCLSITCLLFLLAFKYMDTVIITILVFLSANSNSYISSRFLLIDFSPFYWLYFTIFFCMYGDFWWMPGI